MSDCVKFGTDAEMFVCGCHAYKKYNIHLCPHIARAMSHESFSGSNRRLVKVNMRPRKTVPFYCPYDSTLANSNRENQWAGLSFRPEYLEFWNSEGKSIIEEKGGRFSEDMSPDLRSSSPVIGTDVSRARVEPTIESLLIEPEQVESTTSPSGIDRVLNAYIVAATCLECIPSSYLQAQALQAVGYDNKWLIRLALEILETEIARISLADSTVISRFRTPSFKAAVLSMPDETREDFLRKALETGMFAVAFPSTMFPEGFLFADASIYKTNYA